MWAEIVGGVIVQSVADDAAVTTKDGTQYPWNYPKTQIPDLYQVALAATPDPTKFVVTGSSLSVVNGLPVQTLDTQAISLSALQAAQLGALKAACDAAIVGGYQSSALGAPYTYPSTMTDQINMLGSVSASVLPGLPANWTTVFWCADANGVWGMRPHTAAQIQQAGNDGKAWVTACQTKLATLGAEVMAATTAAAVQAITWS